MFKLLINIHPFYDAPTTGSGGGSGTPSGLPADNKEDVIEFLGGDDETPEETLDLTPKDKDKDKGKDKGKDKSKESSDDKETPETEDETDTEDDEDDTDDELDEIEQELEGPTEEQLELVTPVRRKEILKKYPSLFKDFPYLEKAYYREQQFTELLPTIDDAKKAVESAAILDRFENDLMSGKTETVLKAVKAENQSSFNKIVNDYLPSLARVDEGAYHHVIGNVIKHAIMGMVQEAKSSNNETLRQAAQILNQFTFGSSEFKPPTNLKVEQENNNGKLDRMTEREQEFTRQQFDSTRVDLNSRVNNTLKATISAHIDPKNSMPDYVKKNASRDALENLEVYIGKDARFRTLVDKLWEKAFEERFSKTSTERIRSAYLSKAKTLLPSVIKKARMEALKGIGKRVTTDDNDESNNGSDKKGPVQSRGPRSQSQSSGKIKEAKDIPKGMRTLDFLNSD